MHANASLSTPYATTVQIRDFTVVLDEPPENGGQNMGPKPREMVIAALASCTVITLKMYAGRKGYDTGEIRASVDHSENETLPGETPRPRNHLEVKLSLEKPQPPEVMDRLLSISKKCPVHQMLAPGNEVVVSWAE